MSALIEVIQSDIDSSQPEMNVLCCYLMLEGKIVETIGYGRFLQEFEIFSAFLYAKQMGEKRGKF